MSLDTRAQEIFKKVKDSPTDFKSIWEILCSSDEVTVEDVGYIAKINQINYPIEMDKGELCNHVKGIDWSEFFEDSHENIDLSDRNITRMSWEGVPHGLKQLILKNNKITEMNWKGVPDTLTYINLSGNQITELNWDGCPKNLKQVVLNFNKITKINWKGLPETFEYINLDGNQITEINWKDSPGSFVYCSLENNLITKMNWKDVPSQISIVNFNGNQITELNWDGCPKELQEAVLNFNKITKINWKGLPETFAYISLVGNQITEINWKDSPDSLEECSLKNNLITKMNWKDVPSQMYTLVLEGNKITEINWKDSKPALVDINLNDNLISEMNWEDSKELQYVELSDNKIVKMNWEDSPISLVSVNLDSNKIEDLKYTGISPEVEFLTISLKENPIRTVTEVPRNVKVIEDSEDEDEYENQYIEQENTEDYIEDNQENLESKNDAEINYSPFTSSSCMNQDIIMGEDYIIDEDNDVFIMYSANIQNKFSGSGVCLSKTEMNSYLESGLNDLLEQGVLMALWSGKGRMNSSGFPGYPSGRIVVKIPINGSYVTYGSFKKMMRSKDTKEWYLLPIYGGKRRRVGNLEGSFGSSKNHGQVPGFQINKAYSKDELEKGLVIKETRDDYPESIPNLDLRFYENTNYEKLTKQLFKELFSTDFSD